MISTISEVFDGVELIRPEGDFIWPHPTFKGFPACCGTGAPKTLTNILVPETILGLNVSPACCVHDWMFGNGPKNWQTFHYANAVFLVNLLQINEDRGGWMMKKIRGPAIMAWFTAVSSVAGATAFFSAEGE